MPFLLHENEKYVIVGLNGEQLKLIHGTRAVYVQRWTCSGWQSFIDWPPLSRRQAQQKAVELILKLTGDLLNETQQSYPGPNGHHRPEKATDQEE